MDTGNSELAKQLVGIGISESYASQLANNPPRRTPSLKLALKIHDEIGVKLGPLLGASNDDLPALRKLAERASA